MIPQGKNQSKASRLTIVAVLFNLADLRLI
jgi:hypothetical protein